MAGIEIRPDVLEAFAKSSDGRRSDYDRLRDKAADVRVGRDSFGKVPVISPKIYNAYDEHVRGCEEGIVSAAEAMAAIASGVRAVIVNYERSNQAAKDGLKAVEGALDDVDIRGL